MHCGGFGFGFVDNRFDPTSIFVKKWDKITEVKEDESSSDSEDPSKGELSEAEEYTSKLISTTKMVADSMASLMKMIKDAPTRIQ